MEPPSIPYILQTVRHTSAGPRISRRWSPCLLNGSGSTENQPPAQRNQDDGNGGEERLGARQHLDPDHRPTTTPGSVPKMSTRKSGHRSAPRRGTHKRTRNRDHVVEQVRRVTAGLGVWRMLTCTGARTREHTPTGVVTAEERDGRAEQGVVKHPGRRRAGRPQSEYRFPCEAGSS